MLGINFSEWALIAVVAFIVIGPKELPVVVRHVAGFVKELRAIFAGVKSQMHDLAREAGWDDIIQDVHEMRHTTTIIDLEGKPQKAYDIRSLKVVEHTPIQPTAVTLNAPGAPASDAQPDETPKP